MNRRSLQRLLPLVAIAALLSVVGNSGLAGGAPAPDPCAGSPNPVVCENAKPGNPPSEWDVAGAGDPSIQGFTTEFSVSDGDEVAFKVKTDASAYRLDIYRMGYYAGNGARKVATITPDAPLPQTQPNCLTDAATGLVDCGNWAESARWQVPGDTVSGIYFAHLVRADTGGESHVFFIVRDDDGGSDVLFQTSDTTWQAYNRYGGNSLYVGSPAGRAYKVSYNRPFTTRAYATPSFVWEDEYPMVRWLERNGYDVSYFSGVDTDRLGAELLEHKAFLSVGHDEYWSAGQRANVEAARNAGVNLAFFSSNEIFWKTRWEPSIDGSGREHRTLVSYKETKAAAKIDPTPTWTGTWRDARFSPPSDGGRPENALTGQLFTVDAYRNDPLLVPAEFASMRLWRNTSVAALGPGEVATFSEGIVGHEFDEDVDNGHRPAGLVRLSSTTLEVAKRLVDEGTRYVPGTATHNLTMYRHSSGALVFGAGTSQWSWGLDGEHTYFAGADDVAPDPRLQQATVNLLADMGVQPETRQSDLVAANASTDTSAPTSAITSPASGVEVHAGETLTVTGTASDSGGGVVGAVEVSVDGGATWHPATGRASWTYTTTVGGFGTMQVKSRAADDSGNIETPGPGVSVVITCPCSIWNASVVPATAATTDTKAVNLGVKFRPDVDGYVTGIRYYRGPANGGVHVGSLWTAGGTLLARATFTGETTTGWQQVFFDSPVAVTAGTTYIASYLAPVGRYALNAFYFSSDVHNAPLRALADVPSGGNGVFRYASTSSFPNQSNKASNYWVDVSFDTVLRPDVTPPRLADTSPPAGSTGADPGGSVTASFTEAMNASTLNGGTFQLRGPTGTLIPATVTYDAAARKATLKPSSDLAHSTVYTATVKGGPEGAADTAGNVLAADHTWTFTTSDPRPCPCSLWSDTARPAIASSTDSKAVELGVKFRPDSSGFITAIRFYKGATTNGGTHVGNIWSETGTLLGRATFAGETASGWQTATFATPVPVDANTTYVASYFAPLGRYSLDTDYFVAPFNNAPLRAPSGTNGVFTYGPSTQFPTSSHRSSNYWVDVVYERS